MTPQTGILDASTIRRAMSLYAEALRQHREEINSLNVFPVPDGDTGTNMVLTQEAVERELSAPDGEAITLASLGDAISRASLRGARGNSGVILSQVLRGLFERLPGNGVVTPADLVEGMRRASEEADRAVSRPVDGTILSVLRDAADAAEEAAATARDPAGLLDTVLEAARSSLARTRDILPELRSAGVVDAGAKGFVLLLDSLRAALRGDALSEPVEPLGPVGRMDEGANTTDVGFRYEVQYLLEADPSGAAALTGPLSELGDSLVVVGGSGLYNVHVHTNEAGKAIELALDWGRPRQVSIADLRDQVTQCIAGQARAVRVAEQACALVAILTDGDGLARTFRSLGAVVVSARSADRSPADAVLEAVDAAPASSVVVLPTDPGHVAAAEKAAAEASKQVEVVANGSAAAALAAAAAFNPVEPLKENAAAMREAAAACRSGEVVRADRAVESPAGTLPAGQWLGVADGTVLIGAHDPESVAGRLAIILAGRGAEIVTVVAGETASGEELAAVERIVTRALPEVRVETIDGGQAASRYVIGAE
ncbi:MAG: DAK2 domain-containing protein [Actinomycetota bacterium]